MAALKAVKSLIKHKDVPGTIDAMRELRELARAQEMHSIVRTLDHYITRGNQLWIGSQD